jgi:bifunctional damage-control phosphatase, subfamily II, fusion protein
VTYPELTILVKKACKLNKTLNDAYYNSKKLVLFETGSASPCLDLSRINIELAKCLNEHKIDLIILEGMGRAIHTNFNTKFKTNCLKIAVIKNQWLANRFNLKQIDENKFPIIFKYERI